MTLLAVEGLVVRYGAIEAVRGIDLHVEAGEIVGLIGVNGAGKSTTMLSVVGVVKPVSGTIAFDGQGIVGLSPETILRKGVAPVMEGRRVFPSLTVGENLRLGAATIHDNSLSVKCDRSRNWFDNTNDTEHCMLLPAPLATIQSNDLAGLDMKVDAPDRSDRPHNEQRAPATAKQRQRHRSTRRGRPR